MTIEEIRRKEKHLAMIIIQEEYIEMQDINMKLVK